MLGEFTIAYLLLYNKLQVELYSISRNTPTGVLFSTSIAALVLTLVPPLIVYAGRRRRGRTVRPCLRQ